LIEASASGAGGDARMSIDADGVRWDLTLPLDRSQTKRASATSNPEACSPDKFQYRPENQVWSDRLEGKRILVIEDEPLLAMDIASRLQDAGAYVIGPVGNAPAALSMIEQYRFHAALLDANLGGHPVDDVATSLACNNVPFAFVSGYDRASLPRSFGDAELLPKPFDADQLLELTAKLVA
jgi:CheY-like chemotaxis protein